MQKPEKIVFIQRKQTFIEQSNADPEVAEYFNMSYRAVGSYYKQTGKQFGTGLSKKEEMILMPEMTGFFPDLDKREYHKAVNEFFRNINTKIPPQGLRLNIALEQPDEALSETNPPISIRDYIIFKHAAGHPETGKDLEEAEMYQHKRFYIEDTDSVLSNASGLSKKEDDARLEYYKIIDNPQKVEQMLTLLGVLTTKMKSDKQILKLKQFTTIDESRSASYNEEKLDNFIAISADKRLKTKYDIEEMVKFSVLERVGMKILIAETGDLIGDDLMEAALWFEDKGNTKEVNVLRARYKEFKK
jgi:hypothetical protein